jgi:hypothetical protein
MDVAFITTLVLDDLSDLPGLALDLQDALEQSGFEVKSVTPWARPALQQQGVLPMSQNQTTQQTTNQEPVL